MRTFLLSFAAAVTLAGTSAAQDPPPRFPAADNAGAWKLLPREEPPLPAWARILVRPLPKTTGAMLRLDYVHRADNPLGPALAGKLRWAAADAVGCDYARRYAEADLRRAGLSDDELKRLAENPDDRPVLEFARKMSLAAHEVTDEEVAGLVERFGPEAVVGMAHTLAHANFQNRLFLALGVQIEDGGPLPPVDYRPDPAREAEVPTPPRPPWEELQKATARSIEATRPDWTGRDFAEVLKALDAQKARQPRVPMPGPERLAALPPNARQRTERTAWARVGLGYQPLLTQGWTDCARAFREESQLDRVFTNSMFWVVTRSNECFY